MAGIVVMAEVVLAGVDVVEDGFYGVGAFGIEVEDNVFMVLRLVVSGAVKYG